MKTYYVSTKDGQLITVKAKNPNIARVYVQSIYHLWKTGRYLYENATIKSELIK
jgi:hypothetical protein